MKVLVNQEIASVVAEASRDGADELRRLLDIVMRTDGSLVLKPEIVTRWIDRLRQAFPGLDRFNRPDPAFDESERKYKLEIAQTLRTALSVEPSDQHIEDAIRTAISKGNLLRSQNRRLLGSRVFVCDNMAFSGDQVIKRKHTANLKRDLPGLIGEIVEPLAIQREAQKVKIDRYRATDVDDIAADHAIMEMFRRDVIGIQATAHVHEQWQRPTHPWGPKTGWRLFNAATFALTGKVAERPKGTADLHEIIDQVCA